MPGVCLCHKEIDRFPSSSTAPKSEILGSKKLFFLAINGNYGKIFGKICLSRCFDELKLRIPVWVRLAYLKQLLILLLAVAEIADQAAHCDVAGLEALSFNDRLNVSQA